MSHSNTRGVKASHRMKRWIQVLQLPAVVALCAGTATAHGMDSFSETHAVAGRMLDEAFETANAPVRILMPSTGSHSFHIRATPFDLLAQVLSQYGLAAVVAGPLSSTPLHFAADDCTYEQAAELLQLVTGTLFVPLDATHVLILQDSRENRKAYQRSVVKSFAFSDATAEELRTFEQLARCCFDVESVAIDPVSMRLIVRAPESRITLLANTFATLPTLPHEFLIDVTAIEIDLSRSDDVGLHLPSSATGFSVAGQSEALVQQNQAAADAIVSEGLAKAGDTTTIAAILLEEGYGSGTVLGNPFAVFGGGISLAGIEWGDTSLHLALNASNARMIRKAQLRIRGDGKAVLKVGSRYPIQTSRYSVTSYTSSGSTTTLTPEFSYEDLGLTLKLQASTAGDGRVRTMVDFTLRALTGDALNDIPVLSSRSIVTDLVTTEGSSSFVSSILSRDESKALNGLVPTAARDKQLSRSTSELVLILTPHTMRGGRPQGASPIALIPIHD